MLPEEQLNEILKLCFWFLGIAYLSKFLVYAYAWGQSQLWW